MSIEQTLQSNSVNSLLTLAETVFSGPVQEAISAYLNGVSFNLGDGVTLSVTPVDGTATVTMTPVTITGTTDPDTGTVTIVGSGAYADASITCVFTDAGSGNVSLAVTADSGKQLVWTASSLWPSLLDNTLFGDVTLSGVTLELTTTDDSGNVTIEFQGSATVSYQGTELATGTVYIVADPGAGTPSFLAAVVLPTTWSPGSIWSPLSPLTVANSGVIFSSITSETIALSSLIDVTDVPAVSDSNFSVQAGFSFFTTLSLDTGAVSVLKDLLSATATLSLYANLATDGASSTIIAAMPGFTQGNFTFGGLQLDWENDDGSETITLAASGSVTLDSSDTPLGFKASATIAVSDTSQSCTVTLEVDDWVSPFGYQNLEVKELVVSIALSSTAGAVLTLAGSFEFGTAQSGQFTCDVAGQITDFEDPSGIVFLLQDDSPYGLTLGLVIQEITTVDLSGCPVTDTIDSVFQFTTLGFWAVESTAIVIDGVTYNQGFGIAADFTIYGEQVTLNVDVEEPSGGTPSFSGTASLSEPLVFGSVLTLSGSPDTTVGPDLNVNSSGSPDYFLISAAVAFLDVIDVAMNGSATSAGFQFTFTATAANSAGTWLDDTISILLSTTDKVFDASLSFAFDLSDVTIGPYSIDGYEVVPQETIDLTVDADLTIDADGTALTLVISGDLTFDFDSTTWTPSFSVSLDLNAAISKLSDVGGVVQTWIENNADAIFSGLATDLDTFLAYVQANWDDFENDLVELANILKTTFSKDAGFVVQELYSLGAAVTDIVSAIESAFDEGYDAAVGLVDSALDQAESCAASTAGGNLFSSTSVWNARIPLTGKRLMGSKLYELTASAEGQLLLANFYLHRAEIDQLLARNTQVQSAVRTEIMRWTYDSKRRSRALRLSRAPEAHAAVRRVLTVFAAQGSEGLQTSAQDALAILEGRGPEAHFMAELCAPQATD